MTNPKPSPTEIDHLLSLLGEQYENLPKIAKETFHSLGNEQALCFTNLFNDYIDILDAIHDTYSRGELTNSLVYIYFSGLFKEVYWFQLLFLGGNYPLLNRSLRYVWEMIFRAYYVDTYPSSDPAPPGPTIDDKVEWLAQHEREMFQWKNFIRPTLERLWPQAKNTEIAEYYNKLWNKLNEYVHPSKSLLDRMAIDVPGSLMADIFDEKWALETIETATMVFDLVWLAILTRFSNCTEVLAQKGLLLDYPLVTAALENFSSTE